MQNDRQVNVVPPSPVRVAREAHIPPVSREWLADRTGLALRTIERIEDRKVTPQRSTLRLIALSLGVHIDSLTEREAA